MRWPFAAALLSLACAVAACWEVARDPTQTLLCNYLHPDCLSNHWLMVWVAEQATSFGSLLHNDRYYWPVGDAPWLAGNGSEGFAYAPWHLLLGWPLAANVHLIGILALNGVAAYALARASGASQAASLTAAPAGTLLVFCIQELGAGRFSQVSVCWLGFFLAAWLRFLDGGTRRQGVLAAVMLTVTALFYWYYAFFGVLAGGAMLLARMAGPRRPDVRSLAVFAGAFLVLVAPLLFVFLHNWGAIPGTDEGAFPHPEAINDSTWPGIPFLAAGGRHSGRALPFTTCALAVLGLFRREERWRSVALAGVAVLFAALMAGVLIPHGPYESIYGLAAPLRRFWWPYRHVVVLNLAVIALAARGLDVVTRWRWVGVAVALSIPAQLTAQSAPWHSQFTHVDAPVSFYEGLRDGPGTVLFEPPLSAEIASSQSQLIYQLYHRKALLGGHAMWVGRVRPAAWDTFLAENSFLAETHLLEVAKLDGTFAFRAEDLQALIDAGVGQIVINHEYFPASMKGLVKAYEEVCVALFGPSTRSVGRAAAWDVTRWTGATSVTFTPWVWPAGVAPGGPTLPIQAFHPASLAFSVVTPSGPPPPR